MKIGIVCEGISDYRILKYITERYLRDLDPYTIPLKPKETKQGAQDGFGSWQGVFFAIAIHETECWLIPFVTDDKRVCGNTDSCVNTINKLLKDKGFIDKDNKNAEKVRPIYQNILKQKKKAKDIKAASRHNYGFAYFIDALDTIKANVQ